MTPTVGDIWQHCDGSVVVLVQRASSYPGRNGYIEFHAFYVKYGTIESIYMRNADMRAWTRLA